MIIEIKHDPIFGTTEIIFPDPVKQEQKKIVKQKSNLVKYGRSKQNS